MKGQKHTTYSLEFKQQAVLFASHPDIPVNEVANILGIHPFMLSRWKKEMKDKKLTGKNTITIPKSELVDANKTIAQLEKKLHALEEENEILKKFNRFVADKNRTHLK